jgi:4-amino-4-deoxy-L-arabinose transferase-like glycosyltransferase
MMEFRAGKPTSSHWREVSSVVLVVLVAASLRLYRLDEIPPGLCLDTAYTGVGASRILQGEFPIFFQAAWGGNIEPLYMYVLAPFLLLLGKTPFVLKFVSATLGILTVPVLYVLTRELLGSRMVALLASFLLAVSYWHLNYSRMGREIVLVPLVILATLWLLLRALRTGRWTDFAWAGVSLGIGLYNYQPVRFLPILIVLYLGGRSIVSGGFWAAYRWKLALPVLIALLVFVPLASYYVTHADIFLMNARNVSIFNPEVNEGSPWRALAVGTARTVASLFLLPDPNARQNPAGRPLLDPVTGLFFLVGLGITLSRWRQPQHLLIVVWLVVMALPAVLTIPVPHSARSIGLLPLACILPATGLHAGLGWLRRRSTDLSVLRLSAFVVVILLLVVTLFTYRDYFTVWGTEELDVAFDVPFAQAAEAMNGLSRAGGIWILPLTSLADPELVHETLEFLYQGAAPHGYLRVDEDTVAQELTALTRDFDHVWVVQWDQSALGGAELYYGDPKGALSFLLTKYGAEVGRQEFPTFDITSYRLPASADFALAGLWQPLDVSFQNQLLLQGIAYGGSSRYETSTPSEVEAQVLPSGKGAWVALQWEAVARLSDDYKTAVYLVDGRGRLMAQMDKVLLSDDLRATSQWGPGQVAREYYTLRCPPATPPGQYYMEVGVYDAQSMARVAVLDEEGKISGPSYRAGTLQVVRPLVPPDVEPQVKVQGGELAPEISLLGYDFPQREIDPGRTIRVALYWRATERTQEDYQVAVGLRDGEGDVWAEQVDRPVDGNYPTTQWEAGEVLRDWHDLRVPAVTPRGTYQVYLQVREGGAVVGESSLGEVEVVGRPHYFAVPPIGHTLGVQIGDGARLLGYDVENDQVRAGGVLHLTLYWEAVGKMEASYTVFTHLLDASDHIWAQRDSVPGNGQVRTDTWVEGEIVTDLYELEVDPQTPPGDYLLELGMYDAATGQRLPVYDLAGRPMGDRVLSESITVLP